jgi:hypothetical protein
MELRSSSSPTLLTLPLEVREMILKELFRSMTAYHNTDDDDDHWRSDELTGSEPLEDRIPDANSESYEETAPDRASIYSSDGSISEHASLESSNSSSNQNTSILRTCRQLYNEARPLLAPNILLGFCSTSTMLDTLTTLPPSIIENLRHMRLESDPFPLYRDDNPFSYITYSPAHTLPMFPGLQLDVLTVGDCYHFSGHVNDAGGACGTYYDIQTMLEADGWKELRYIIPTTEFMTSHEDEYRSRVAQPAGWDKKLREKDGETSGAEVRMYVAGQMSLAGSTEPPFTRSSWEAVPGHLLPLPPLPDWDREVIVIAKRGAGAKYVQDGSTMREHIRRLLDKMSWAELKKSGKYIPPRNYPWCHL